MTARNGSASLVRRLAFGSKSYYFFDKLFCQQPLARISRWGDQPAARIPDHFARVAYDLVESIRTRRWAPDIGNAELALLHATDPLPQNRRYLSYWHDPAINTTAGTIVGVDLIRHNGKYHVIEINRGPSIYPRRREMYAETFDPMFWRIFESAPSEGYRKIVPIAFRWHAVYIEEFERASHALGIPIVPHNCPLQFPECPRRMFALPDPIEPETLYVIHSGLMSPAVRYLDDKWYSWQWLEHAIREEMPGTLVALPATHDDFVFPLDDHGPRWPNLVVKLASSARSTHVIAARFDSVDEAREALGVGESGRVPDKLRTGFVKGLLFHGSERVLYQAYVPPELDEREHARMLRLHLWLSPQRTLYLAAHARISQKPVPKVAPRGIIRQDGAYIFNDAEYARLSPEMEEEIRSVAADLGGAMQRALERKFETGPAQANSSAGSTTAIR
ncbi:MAG TPA: hypothetical protein VNI54_06200 [Thermoanaerobaculia bacterium]|nr:hypothetical protein [Thermoanaerobaculia bacterium]